MVTGEKREEFRVTSKWIESRLIDSKTGEDKVYDLVEFVNGYGSWRLKSFEARKYRLWAHKPINCNLGIFKKKQYAIFRRFPTILLSIFGKIKMRRKGE